MLDNISLFISVVEAGSLKKASEQSGIPTSTVSRRMKALEDAFGCQLITRNSHSFELTREGVQLYQQSNFHIQSVDTIVNELRSDIEGERGTIKVLAPTNLSTSVLHCYFTQYLRQYPDIELELELSNELKPFYSSNADFAIRTGPQPDSDLTQLKLGQVTTLLIASPQFVANRPPLSHPKQIDELDCILSVPFYQWELKHQQSSARYALTLKRKKAKVNDLQMAKQFVKNDLGIALLPSSEVTNEIKTGELVNVLPDWRGETRDIYAVWYRRQRLSHRASRLIDYIKANWVDLKI